MKKTFISILCCIALLCGLSSTAGAAPYLTCAKDVNATAYDVWMDGTTVATNITPTQGWRYGVKVYFSNPPPGATEVHVLLDCASVTIADGAHRFEASAKNLWGVSARNPLDFAKALPGAPQGLQLLGE